MARRTRAKASLQAGHGQAWRGLRATVRTQASQVSWEKGKGRLVRPAPLGWVRSKDAVAVNGAIRQNLAPRCAAYGIRWRAIR